MNFMHCSIVEPDRESAILTWAPQVVMFGDAPAFVMFWILGVNLWALGGCTHIGNISCIHSTCSAFFPRKCRVSTAVLVPAFHKQNSPDYSSVKAGHHGNSE